MINFNWHSIKRHFLGIWFLNRGIIYRFDGYGKHYFSIEWQGKNFNETGNSFKIFKSFFNYQEGKRQIFLFGKQIF